MKHLTRVLIAGALLFGPVAPAGAESRDDCRSGGCGNDQRRCEGAEGDCRGSFSPGPFDRSPVDIHDNQLCFMPGSCTGQSDSGEPQPT